MRLHRSCREQLSQYPVRTLTRAIVNSGRAKAVLHYVMVDADLIKKLEKGRGRVVITEGRLKRGKLRFDFAEIDSTAKRIEV